MTLELLWISRYPDVCVKENRFTSPKKLKSIGKEERGAGTR